jgi:hypothetical protein
MSAHAGLQDDRLPNRCNPIPERWNAAAIGESHDPSRLHQVGHGSFFDRFWVTDGHAEAAGG